MEEEGKLVYVCLTIIEIYFGRPFRLTVFQPPPPILDILNERINTISLCPFVSLLGSCTGFSTSMTHPKTNIGWPVLQDPSTLIMS